MLPVEDSLWVAQELGRRFGLPRWQFTLSATTANIEAIRLARFANALSMSAARATLNKVMTREAYAHAAQLGALLAEGIERISRKAGYSWSAHRLFARSGYTYAERLPRNAAEYYEHDNVELDLLKRVYFANRGVWEALIGAGPTASVAATRKDVDHYLAVLEEFVGELAA